MANWKPIDHAGYKYKALADWSGYDPAAGRVCILTDSGAEWMTVDEAVEREFLRLQAPRKTRKPVPVVDSLPWNSSGPANPLSLTNHESREGTIVVHDAVPGEFAAHEWYLPMDLLGVQVALSCGLIHPVARRSAATLEAKREVPGSSSEPLWGHRSPPHVGPGRFLLRLRIQPGEFGTEASASSGIRLRRPIPISRLIGIGVPGDREQWGRIAASWVAPDVPAAEHLFEPLVSGLGPGSVDDAVVQGTGQVDSRPLDDVAAPCKRFDRYLGLMSFLRGASRFLSARTEHYQDDSAAFLALLSRLLRTPPQGGAGGLDPEPLLCSLLDLDVQLTPGTTLLRDLAASDARIVDESAGRGVAKAIFEDAARDPLMVRAFKDLFAGDYRSAMQSLQRSSAPSAAMAFAALFKYSSRLSNDHRTLKQRLVAYSAHRERSDRSIVNAWIGIVNTPGRALPGRSEATLA